MLSYRKKLSPCCNYVTALQVYWSAFFNNVNGTKSGVRTQLQSRCSLKLSLQSFTVVCASFPWARSLFGRLVRTMYCHHDDHGESIIVSEPQSDASTSASHCSASQPSSSDTPLLHNTNPSLPLFLLCGRFWSQRLVGTVNTFSKMVEGIRILVSKLILEYDA